MGLQPSFRDMASSELVSFLLEATGQNEQDAVNPSPMLDLLGLKHLSLDFVRDIPEAVTVHGERPRALLSFPERVVATEQALSDKQARFSTFHEIGHYVLPQHLEAIVLCTERDLSPHSRTAREQDANAFAAELLFHGHRFLLDANSRPICALTVKDLAIRYQASFEATARRLVEKNLRPCMLVVFQKVSDDGRIDLRQPVRWEVKYSAASRLFALRFFRHLQGSLPSELATALTARGRDIAATITQVEQIKTLNDVMLPFVMEYFYNQHDILCLVQPE